MWDDASMMHAGQAAVVPAGERHGVRALDPCRVIVVDYPSRTSVGGLDTGAVKTPLSSNLPLSPRGALRETELRWILGSDVGCDDRSRTI